MLVLSQFFVVEGFPLLQVRQGGGLLLLVVGVLPLLVDGSETRELQGGVAGPENIAGIFHVDGQTVIECVGHLAGHKPGPNQLIQLKLLGGQVLLDVLGDQGDIGRPDSLVGVLSIATGLKFPGLGWAVAPAIPLGDKAPGSGHRLVRQAQRVGTHIGDQTHRPLAGDVNALIELLGHRHGAGRGHIQLAAGLLLEGGGGKGRGWLAVLLLPLHLGDGPPPHSYSVNHRLGLRLAAQLHLLIPPVELGLESAQIRRHTL